MATLAVAAAAFKNALPKLPRLPPYEGLVFMLHRRINILLDSRNYRYTRPRTRLCAVPNLIGIY
jgi:hypothetical protein